MTDLYLQVIDRSGAQIGEYSDLSKVEKFEITDDAYEKRTGTAGSDLLPSLHNRGRAGNSCVYIRHSVALKHTNTLT